MTDNQDAILKRLNGEFRKIAELVGVENALKISKELGGQWVTIPKLDSLRQEVRNVEIREEYDRARDKTAVVRRLAKQHDLTTRQIYNILGTEPPDKCDFVLPLFFKETP